MTDIIPPSTHTVGVKIIDTTTHMHIPVSVFNGDKIDGHDFLDAPAWSFLIEHESGKKVLFDLGLRADLDGFSPAIRARLEALTGAGAEANVKKGVAEVLKENDVDPGSINTLIWR